MVGGLSLSTSLVHMCLQLRTCTTSLPFRWGSADFAASQPIMHAQKRKNDTLSRLSDR